jgi:SAM-dependent methyltransferase
MPQCRLCDAVDEYQAIRAPDVFGGQPEHHFWQCEKCDAIYLYPVPTVEEEKVFYLKEFEGFMSTRVGDHRDWSNANKHKISNQDQVTRRLPFIEKYLKPGVDLLEIGCSSGFMLDMFREKGANCVGIEPSGEFSEFLQDNGHQVFNDLSEVTGQQFDIITHYFVFEHIRDPFTFLKQSYDLVKPGGVMVCEIPCANDPLTDVFDIPAFELFYWSIAHHYYYTPKSLEYLLNLLGYRFELVPEQRYDISNHMTWMLHGKPGGQGKYNDFLGEEVVSAYKRRMIDGWSCDTVFMYIWK